MRLSTFSALRRDLEQYLTIKIISFGSGAVLSNRLSSYCISKKENK